MYCYRGLTVFLLRELDMLTRVDKMLLSMLTPC
jgi:hypothetical protein